MNENTLFYSYRITPHIRPGPYIRYKAHPRLKKNLNFVINIRPVFSGFQKLRIDEPIYGPIYGPYIGRVPILYIAPIYRPYIGQVHPSGIFEKLKKGPYIKLDYFSPGENAEKK